jgi:hypothetical protein
VVDWANKLVSKHIESSRMSMKARFYAGYDYTTRSVIALFLP